MEYVEKPRPQAPRLAQGITILGFLALYLPLLVLVICSFLSLSPLSPRWTLEGYRKALSNPAVWDALFLSLWVGGWSTLVSTVIGTGAALAIQRGTFPGRRIFDAITYIPLIMPELVLGLALLIWFVFLRVSLGTLSIILAHITFSVSYVVITVKTRLHGFDDTLEEAARDLGADAWNTFWRITFPLIRPGILSGALMAFTLSFDDFLITFFTAGPGSDTLPVKVYSMIKFGVGQDLNALSTLMLGATLVLVVAIFRK